MSISNNNCSIFNSISLVVYIHLHFKYIADIFINGLNFMKWKCPKIQTQLWLFGLCTNLKKTTRRLKRLVKVTMEKSIVQDEKNQVVKKLRNRGKYSTHLSLWTGWTYDIWKYYFLVTSAQIFVFKETMEKRIWTTSLLPNLFLAKELVLDFEFEKKLTYCFHCIILIF